MEKWFLALSDDPVGKILSLCRQPFPEIKLAGYLVLQNIAHQEWGQKLINNCPGRNNKLKIISINIK